MKFRTIVSQPVILALCVVAVTSPTLGETAKWINTNGGNMNAAANWQNGYIPQAGDTHTGHFG